MASRRVVFPSPLFPTKQFIFELRVSSTPLKFLKLTTAIFLSLTLDDNQIIKNVQCFDNIYISRSLKPNIFKAPTAASTPLFPKSPPLLALLCSRVSSVNTQNITGLLKCKFTD